MIVVPEPVPLDMPPGDPAALEDFAEDVAGSAYRLAVVSTCLTSSTATAPHWRGADAAAAGAQVGIVASLAEELSGGVAAAAHRLGLHHERLVEVRRRITALRAEQDEDFALAWGRLARIENYRLVAITDGPEAAGVVEDLRASETARRREHDRLLDELAADAAATAQTLAEAGRPIGGTGRRGDDARVVAHLATQLPGWGDAELRRRGSALAGALTGGPVTPEEMDLLARGDVDYAGTAAFARGLFAGLGVDGMRWLLAALGYNTLGDSSGLARVLAAALGAAVSGGREADPVGQVLDAEYVAADDRHGDSDVMAAGLAAVMGAGLGPGRSDGVRPETAARWARQMLERERLQGLPAGVGAVPMDWDGRLHDPLEVALGVISAGGATAPAAELLGDRPSWDVVLARFWADGGQALSGVVELAGAEPGEAGHAAVRSGLEALGGGLSHTGDPAEWTVHQATAAAVAGSLGDGVAAHISVAVDVLRSAVDGRPEGGTEDALRGLGYLTLDRHAAATVGSALIERVAGSAEAIGWSSAGSPLAAVALPGAYHAVQEYGQRLAYAIHGFEAQAAAETRETVWNWTWGLAVEFVRGPAAVPAGLLEDYAAILLGADGTWDNGIDEGLVFEREAAVRDALARLGPDQAAEARELAAQTRRAYERTAEALGLPKPPTSPESDYWEPLLDAVTEAGLDKAGDIARR
jgi:hypothetical protein